MGDAGGIGEACESCLGETGGDSNVVASGDAALNPLRGKTLASKVCGSIRIPDSVELNVVLFVTS